MAVWTSADIPDQSGRTVVVTGANSGIGFEAASLFARKGANVVLACRDQGRGAAAAERITELQPAGSAEFLPLDLADLASVAQFADLFLARHDRLDVIVANAAVMWTPPARTAQGFELQFGTNHLGHFALTGMLLPAVLRTPDARVVTMTSLAQISGRIEFTDLDWRKRRYSRGAAYAQSKLANMMFTLELDRRLRAASSGVRATSAHPGWTKSNLTRHLGGPVSRLSQLPGMKTAVGVLGLMRAATDPSAPGGSHWGPRYCFETRGHPVPARIPARAKDPEVAALLWDCSSQLTGVSYPFGQGG